MHMVFMGWKNKVMGRNTKEYLARAAAMRIVKQRRVFIFE